MPNPMLILAVNSGSATLKLEVMEITSAGGPRWLAQARFEQPGCAARAFSPSIAATPPP